MGGCADAKRHECLLQLHQLTDCLGTVEDILRADFERFALDACLSCTHFKASSTAPEVHRRLQIILKDLTELRGLVEGVAPR